LEDEIQGLRDFWDAALRKSRRKFVRFVERYEDGFAWTSTEAPVHCRIDPSQLESVLKRIYTARSDYLHNGKPMWVDRPRKGEVWDWDCAAGMIDDQRRRDTDEKLPYPRWFQSLVCWCLLRHIDSLTAVTAP
jgi:hypothetical protein